MSQILISPPTNDGIFDNNSRPNKQSLAMRLNKINLLIESAEQDDNKLETNKSSVTSNDASQQSEVLMAVSVRQSQIVEQMVSSNPESEISCLLASGIEAYSKKLEDINAWTEGGIAVITPLLSEMEESIFADDKVEGTEYEDLVQIMIIDIMINGHGDVDLPSDWDEMAGYFLESAGSGGHSPMLNVTPSEFAGFMEEVYDVSLQLPADRLAHQVASEIKKNYYEGFDSYVTNMDDESYWSNSEGFIDGFDGDKEKDYGTVESSTKISPFLKLVVISTATSSTEGLSAEDYDAIARAESVDEVKKEIGDPKSMSEWICDNNKDVDVWQGTGLDGVDGDGEKWMNFPGYGINPSYLEKLFVDFPSRDLTEDEIKQVNDIGDQVKVLQQALLYWLKVCRDEQLASARQI